MNQDAEDLDDGVKKLIGKTISHVWVDMNDGELEFRLSTNNVLHIWHQHQCCECVYLADIAGVDSVNQLEGETVLDAYVSYSDGGPVEDELQKKRQHMDERMYVKSLLSLDDTIDCCARIIHKNICLTSRDITRMCKEAKDVLSSRVR